MKKLLCCKSTIIASSLLIGGAHGLAFTNAVLDFSLGAAAGGVGAFVAYPIDYVTCQMQTGKYNNGIDCLVDTVSTDWTQLFQGCPVAVLGVAPEKAIKLGIYDMVKQTLAPVGLPWLTVELLAAALAGTCQVVATCPMETLKVGFQTASSNTNTTKTLSEMVQQSSLFQGAQACILRDVLIGSVIFPLYATLIHQQHLPSLLAGSLAGLAAGVVGAPPDFIKTRIMTNNVPTAPTQAAFVPSFVVEYQSGNGEYQTTTLGGSDTTITTTTPTNPIVAGRCIAQAEGWQVLFSGVAERCAASIPRFGVTLALYDQLKYMAAMTIMTTTAPPQDIAM